MPRLIIPEFKTLFGGFALSLVACAPLAANANDLLDAYHDAADRDTVLKSSYFQREAAVEVQPQALAAFLPQLNANASLTREREAYPVGVVTSVPGTGGTGIAPQTVTSTMQQAFYGSTRNYGLTLSQTIWSFESFQRLREAHSQVAEAEAVYRSAQQALILRVAQAYFAILSAADNLETNRVEREAFGGLLHQAQVRLDTGISARTDVQEAQSFYDVTATGVIDAQDTLADAKRAMAAITGRYAEAIEPLQADIPLAAPTPSVVDSWVDAARNDNFDVQAALLKSEAAKRDLAANRAKYLPTLSLQGSAAKTEQDSNFGGDQSVDAIGAVVTWPIFLGGSVQSLVRQARATYNQTLADYDGSQREAERQARKAFRGVLSGIDRIKANQQAVGSNEAALGASKIGLELATRTEFDLLNAQNNYYSALRSFHQSRYDYLSNVLTLKQQAGRLTEADLAEIDRLLVSGEAVGALGVEAAQ